MAHNPASELASAIQSVSLNRAPSPAHDINPSTAASKKFPAEIVSPTHSPAHSPTRSHSGSLSSATSTIPSDIIAPRPRRKSFPPIPDFRFEQSYLASLKNAQTNWQVAYITIRDQVLMPLAQGIGWNLAVFGWKHWNKGTRLGGRTLGARLRRWWWGVNNWKFPGEQNREKAGQASDFFVNKFSSGGD